MNRAGQIHYFVRSAQRPVGECPRGLGLGPAPSLRGAAPAHRPPAGERRALLLEARLFVKGFTVATSENVSVLGAQGRGSVLTPGERARAWH